MMIILRIITLALDAIEDLHHVLHVVLLNIVSIPSLGAKNAQQNVRVALGHLQQPNAHHAWRDMLGLTTSALLAQVTVVSVIRGQFAQLAMWDTASTRAVAQLAQGCNSVSEVDKVVESVMVAA
jgi:hypothetical protein